MNIKGSVTISLRDYHQLVDEHKRAEKALDINRELLRGVSSMVSAIAYDEELAHTPENAERVLAHIKVLANSIPGLKFYSDSKNSQIVIVADET